MLSLSPTLSALGSSLQQTVVNFKELQNELEQLSMEVENYKTELLAQREQCESKTCVGSEALKKIIDAKDTIINSVASTATKLNETKNFTFLNEILKILYGETTVLTPLKEHLDIKIEHQTQLPSYTPEKSFINPKKELYEQDESILEIEGTPTSGRISPIIAPKKKIKSSSFVSLSGDSVDSRDKKKCPNEWPTPEAKQVKLNCPSPSLIKKKTGIARMKQARLYTIFTKTMNTVDLTSSPECAGGRNESFVDVKLLIKKESSDNDDTILPSPTSGPANFLLLKTATKESNYKFKKPLSLTRTRTEFKEEVNSPILQVTEKKSVDNEVSKMEHSINILQPNRFQNGPKSSPMKNHPMCPKKSKSSPKKESKSPKKKSPKRSPKKSPMKAVPMEENITHFDDASISILQHIENLEANQPGLFKDNCSSPTKRPLAENINATNIPSTQSNAGDSISLLQDRFINIGSNIQNNAKRKTPENVQPLYKEPLPRKKAEKQALPAWLCDECKGVLNDLYADDPDKVARIVARCSKHRGRTNPIRPKTPPGFWYPRWEVPENTEEFNRRNNVNEQ